MSIAQEERQINQIINTSKLRLRQVEEKLEMLVSEKQSIDEDIGILSTRAETIRGRLSQKKIALQNIVEVTAQSEDAFKKLKESTKILLMAVKKEVKKVDDLTSEDEEQEGN